MTAEGEHANPAARLSDGWDVKTRPRGWGQYKLIGLIAELLTQCTFRVLLIGLQGQLIEK